MEWLSALASSTNPWSAILGGISGVIGSIFGKWMELKYLKEKNSFKLKSKELDLQAMDKEHAYKVEMEDIQLKKIEEEYMGKAHTEAIKGEARSLFQPLDLPMDKTWVTVLVVIFMLPIEALRKATRPVLTWFSVGYVAWLMTELKPFYDLSFKDVNAQMDLYSLLVNAFVYGFLLCLSFWFCGRSQYMDKFVKKLTDD